MPEVILVILFGLLGGMAVALQGPMASMITEKIGVLGSIFIVHVSGAILVLIPMAVMHAFGRSNGEVTKWQGLPWYAWLAGIWGLIVISAVSYAFPRVGATGSVVLIVAGQMILSVVLDHFGLMGAEVRHLNVQRLLGVTVMFAGVWLIVR